MHDSSLIPLLNSLNARHISNAVHAALNPKRLLRRKTWIYRLLHAEDELKFRIITTTYLCFTQFLTSRCNKKRPFVIVEWQARLKSHGNWIKDPVGNVDFFKTFFFPLRGRISVLNIGSLLPNPPLYHWTKSVNCICLRLANISPLELKYIALLIVWKNVLLFVLFVTF